MVTFNELKITPDGTQLIIDVSVKSEPYYEDIELDSILIDTQDTFIESGPSEKATKYPINAIQDAVVITLEDFTPINEYTYRFKGSISENVVYKFENLGPDKFEDNYVVLDFGDFNYIPDSLEGKYFTYNSTIKDLDSVNVDKVKHSRTVINVNDTLISFKDNLLFVYVTTKGTPTSDTPCGMDNMTTLGVVSNLYPIYQHALNYLKELGNTCIIPMKFINFILQYKALQLAIRTGHYTEAIKYWKRFFSDIKDVTITSRCGCYG